MSEEGTLAEGVGMKASKEPIQTVSQNISTDSPVLTSAPETSTIHTYMVRWDREPEKGKPTSWFPVAAESVDHAAILFAHSTDVGNVKPPVRRDVIVRRPDGVEERLAVAVKTVLEYRTVEAV
jgi:hypothetical protein